MFSQSFDVIVIGSGPSGAMAAIELAKHGLSTAVIEKEALPRRKVCAGGLLHRAAALLPLDLDYPVQKHCHRIALGFQQRQHCFEQSADHLVTMVCRRAFDFSLLEYAAKLGAVILDNVVIDKVTPLPDGVNIDSQQGSFKASYIILAEGANARISNRFWHDDRHLIPSVEVDAYLPETIFQQHSERVFFDFDAVDAGYGWVFPKNDHLSIGLGSFGHQHQQLNQQLIRYIDRLGLSEHADIRYKKGFVIPVSPRTDIWPKQRMIMVGDAAGFADPITAEGLTHAIQSGQEAGKAVCHGFEDPQHVAALYREGIEKPIIQELKAAQVLAKIMYATPPSLRDMIFRRYGQRFCQAMVEIVEGKRSYSASLQSKLFMRMATGLKII